MDERVVPFIEQATTSPSAEVRMRAAAILKLVRVDPLEKFCAQPDAQLDVELGMFYIAQILNPQVKQADLTRQLDDIAAKVRAKLGKDVKPAAADPQLVVTALRQVIFEDLKFAGNTEAYRHIDNCSLERVLATRKGLPITLSRLVMLVARRLEVPIVGLPVIGQYLVKYDGAQAPAGFAKDDIYIHPFLGGKILSREDRQALYPNHDPDRMVPPDTNRAALIRILNNVGTALGTDPEQRETLNRAQRMLELLRLHQGVLAP
jgi:regulator of sirC expression with transglutaminase-like and TPR domain